MPLRILLSAMLALIFCATPALAETPPGPGPKDRCAVCGMFVAPYPNWVAVIQFEDGTNAYFDGPKDMFIYYFDFEKFRPASKIADISNIYVTEYYTTRLMKAEEVFFVTGSDILGPMGNELVPVQGLEQAKTFLRDHDGKKIMQFDGKNLTERPADR
ncbi:MAG: hypothetical protein A2X84_03600 [Desulfuromonadaceae bacterium GWC2_58_13]|nr:MAG: hypothetical protein A2X84_03600 [Desulfuromonadaceae bacterium GWC2_58_13]